MSKVQSLLSTLPPAERELVEAHLVGGTSSRWLAATLTRNGYPIGKTTIDDWRKKRG